jgi:hypothetical protein
MTHVTEASRLFRSDLALWIKMLPKPSSGVVKICTALGRDEPCFGTGVSRSQFESGKGLGRVHLISRVVVLP